MNQLARIIQGGMGVNISNWFLANTVSRLGQLGVVSGTGLDAVITRTLQQGDPGGHIRRAAQHFPFPEISKTIVEEYLIPGGKAETTSFKRVPMPRVNPSQSALELMVFSNFVEVWLAKEGHNNPVGINYLEKIQRPILPSLYGAILAGANVVCMGAGIPIQVPEILKRLSSHQEVSSILNVIGASKEQVFSTTFDPRILGNLPREYAELQKPDFYLIASSETLPKIFIKNNVPVDGIIIEGNLAGGHNAVPKGQVKLNERGEPIYGDRDIAKLDKIASFGIPYWLAGGYGSPEKLNEAIRVGAAGVQPGTVFALCEESGLEAKLKSSLREKIVGGDLEVLSDPDASPTGYPIEIAQMRGTLTDSAIYDARRRACDVGMLATLYLRPDGTVGSRCPAEPVEAYIQKGGAIEDTVGKVCLCDALPTTADIAQTRHGKIEPAIVTLGKDLDGVTYLGRDGPYFAEDVVNYIDPQ